MSFDTQLGINQEHFTQRIRELAIDSEPVLKLPLYVANAWLRWYWVIQFSSVGLQIKICNYNSLKLVAKK